MDEGGRSLHRRDSADIDERDLLQALRDGDMGAYEEL